MSYREIIKSNVTRREKAITGVSRRNQAFDKACKFVCMGVFFLTWRRNCFILQIINFHTGHLNVLDFKILLLL